jgi:hypothetical protein
MPVHSYNPNAIALVPDLAFETWEAASVYPYSFDVVQSLRRA